MFCVCLTLIPSVIPPPSLSSVEHVKFYRKEDIPGHFHYRDNDRIPPIMGFADLGWAVRHKRYDFGVYFSIIQLRRVACEMIHANCTVQRTEVRVN